MSRKKTLSIVVPLFNEEQVLPILLQRLLSVVDSIVSYDIQIIMVDDGSSDKTWNLLETAAHQDYRIHGLSFSRNFGQQSAYLAALEHATGDVVVLMDADLQDPPEIIPTFLKLFEEGYDVVYGKRARRKESFLLRLCYFTYYRLLASIANTWIPKDSGDFALISRAVLDVILSSRERPKFIRGLRSWAGFKQIGVDINRPERAGGESKYSIRKLLKLGLDGIFSFSTLPLQLASVIGLWTVAASVLFGGYAVGKKLLGGETPSGFTALLVTMIFLSGVQMLLLGLLSQYVARLCEQAKERPAYVIRKKISHDSRTVLRSKAS